MRKLVAAVAVSALLVAGFALAQPKGSKGTGHEQLNLFGEAFDRIRQDSVEPASGAKLVDAAITGMLSGLDPRSAYIDEAAFKALQKPAHEDQAGLGMVLTIENGELRVISAQDGSPAEKAGIQPGDLIFAVEKEPAYEMTLAEAEQTLRGPTGSEVELALQRGDGQPVKLRIRREAYQLQTVTARLEGEDIGYLRIAGFDDATQAAAERAVRELRQRAGNQLLGFIVDLRNNPGGSFDAAVAVADAFIDNGDIVVVKGRKPASVKRISATPGDIAQGLPIVVLVNGGTAREAELVAGALQDNHRAVLLGTRTFGDSSIESLIPLPGHGAIRLTTARFTTPSGRRIQGKGLDPDLTVIPLKLAKLGDGGRLHEADLRGALRNTDPTAAAAKEASASASATLADGAMGSATDEQLSEAADVLRGLVLASGRAG
jgi:carboxyl-terminal processing protease